MSKPTLMPHWKQTMHMAFDDHYEQHYNDPRLGICAMRYTERISECEVGKSRMYFQIMGQKRSYRTQAALMLALKRRQTPTAPQ